jgi:hypothetical protein
MKKLGFVILALVAAFFTNPSLQHHRDSFDQEFRRDHPVLGMFGGGTLASQALTYHNYFLFSTAEFGHKTVSVGALGMVHVRTASLSDMADELQKN